MLARASATTSRSTDSISFRQPACVFTSSTYTLLY